MISDMIRGQSGCFNVPKNCLKVLSSLSQGALKVFQGAPTFFRYILLLQHPALWCLKLPQVVSQGVSICVVKIFYFKN